jgi:hypothetical protein
VEKEHSPFKEDFGGEGGIRTPGTNERTVDLESENNLTYSIKTVTYADAHCLKIPKKHNNSPEGPAKFTHDFGRKGMSEFLRNPPYMK